MLYRNSQHREFTIPGYQFLLHLHLDKLQISDTYIVSPWPLVQTFTCLDFPLETNKAEREKMGVAKRTRKFAEVRRLIGQRDARLKKNQEKAELENKKKNESASGEVVREM